MRGASVAIEVVNAGTPIAASDIAKIFLPFQRQSTTSKRQGLGLGLYICEQIASAHGGTLDAVADDDGRTRFTATVPLRGPARP